MYVLLRVVLVVNWPTQVHHPEEIVNLRLAAAVLGEADAWPVPLPEVAPPPPGSIPRETSFFDYQYQYFDGGTLVVAIVLVPIAAVLGLTTASVKTGAILWATAAVLLWVLLMGRLFGRPGAVIAATAMVAAPVPHLLLSSIHWGNHAESALFPPLILLLLVQASRTPSGPQQTLLASGAGLAAGFGAWFSLLNLLPAALCALGLGVLMGRSVTHCGPAFAVGAAVGFLPWLGRNDLSGSLGAQGVSLQTLLRNVVSGEGQTQGQQSVLEVWPRFTSWDLPGMWVPPASVAQSLDLTCRIGVAVGACVAIAAVLDRLRAREPRAREIAVVVGTLAVAYSLIPVLLDASWELRDRRLASLYPLGWMLVTAGLASLWEYPKVRPAALVLAVAIFVPNLAAEVRLIAGSDRPAGPIEAWTHFAVPEDEPRWRLEAGVSQLTAAEVVPLNHTLGWLLASTRTRGADEVRGLARALVVYGDQHVSGALRRSNPVCPGEDLLEQAQIASIASEREALAFGAGLRIRCDSVEADVRCGRLATPYVAPCRTGTATPARRDPATPE